MEGRADETVGDDSVRTGSYELTNAAGVDAFEEEAADGRTRPEDFFGGDGSRGRIGLARTSIHFAMEDARAFSRLIYVDDDNSFV